MTYFFQTTVRQSAVLALLLLGSVRLGFAQSATKEQLIVALSAPGKRGSLEVGLVSGTIHIIGYGGREVVIEAAPRPKKQPRTSPGNAAGLRRISTTGPLSLNAEEKNNHVGINTDSWKGSVDLTIQVPRNFSLRVSTVNDGNIIIDSVAGELEVTNTNGYIQLNQVAGSAVANTVNGDIRATFTSITAGAPMAFSTLNGKVDVTLPANARATLKLQSDQGEVYSDFALILRKGPPGATHTTQNGLSHPSTAAWTYGKINGGGAELMLKTFNGDIFLRKAK